MKIWKQYIMFSEEQKVKVQPSSGFSGIELSFSESDDTQDSGTLYLGEDELKALITTLQDMMNYVKS